jgi:hypothetical protein
MGLAPVGTRNGDVATAAMMGAGRGIGIGIEIGRREERDITLMGGIPRLGVRTLPYLLHYPQVLRRMIR